MEKCKLCEINLADKKNSHTIPKFFGKTMLRQNDNKFSGYKISLTHESTNLSPKKIQDIHKEDYIFCSTCESNLSKIETTFSNQIYNKLKHLKRELSDGEFAFSKIPINHFLDIKLLVYSVIWRANLNQIKYPESFLNENIVKKLRSSIFYENIEDNIQVWIAYCPENNPIDNIIHIVQNENFSILFLNEIIVFTSFNNSRHPLFFPNHLALNQKDCSIILFSKLEWESIRISILKESFKWLNDK